ncbi:MAG: glucuronate isomerase, partial [Clostridia bacterium]|nr:glucuronate isomerase [Clostridia bacterium]
MKPFMNEDFILKTETAKKLYAMCSDMPIIDYHCHI